MKKVLKIILAILLFIFIAIQFYQPALNVDKGQVYTADFSKVYTVPPNVQNILQNACYDCHSNNTNNVWYSNIQPMAWLMKKHIDNGKEQLNFSEFGSFSSRRQISKLRAIANQIKDEEMPLGSYKIMHRNAQLSKEQKSLLMNWMNKKADSLSTEN
ncbi:heme-binding domain-containing protein [Epilithonimonas ginsengisoli]|uniref:Haem-binding domain-containing protein n=2 Tax=Chryseobacterium group TaxID=2782232 RepID=A0AAX2IFE2_9FLAO|nr:MULTISPECIES: heme-binding domain-containing protein [Chryseobacterium group]AZB31814.1 cytochrome C [Chryseobacterium balustinum]MBV6879127.1 heme-binding domain-containing protein [Epilithonimonas sp. FP105]MDW8549560.1 heme-binding domain-containing protein [Epilithonimonas ginsengisoli]OAH74422.1 cytochrome C [Chryseobacterium sp. FP211-J200]SKC06089.1 Haem-binding domain-containing protein [Chryseobacterium balustinum]